MARIIATESVSLDGIMQAPARADEDTRDGFAHGGWADGFADAELGRFMGEGMAQSSGMLFGRRTYEDLLGHWTAAPEPNPFKEVFLNAPKWVVSRSTDTTLDYPNSTLLAGEAAETVADLVDQVDGSLTVLGSGELVRSLRAAGLVDGYVLLVHPMVLGQGQALFDEGDRDDLELVRSATSGTGVLLAEYRVRRD